ncbi:hypothetical protein [Neobacillus mesonae]|nr:hypothetical protein [Neobacillus mesonae]MED4203725.1 hypothetical protein [Neobacillus mesonae]
MDNSKTLIELFLREDRFELNDYLTFLFNQIADYFPETAEENIANQ